MTIAERSPRSFLTIASGVLIFIAVLLLIYSAYLTTRPVLPALVLAAVASLVSRYFVWMVRFLSGRRRLAALVSVLILLTGKGAT
jgi:hypothetical protein